MCYGCGIITLLLRHVHRRMQDRRAAFRHKMLVFNMRHRHKLRLWFSMLTLTFLLWLRVLIAQDRLSPAAPNSSLRGYSRISPHRKTKFLDVHCNHCAIVSSSGQMLGTGAGHEIDRTECVIRMNNAPTRGYEKDVGNRTTVRVVSHSSVPLLVENEQYYFKQSANTTYVFWGPKRIMRQDGEGIIFNILLKLAVKYRRSNMYVMTQSKIKYCDSVFQNETGKNRMKTGAFLSTGFFTMILAKEMCDRITVYGMIDDNYCSQANHSDVPYHYYEQKRLSECRVYKHHEFTQQGAHRFITEKAIFAKWATRHNMEFKHPAWKR